MLGFAVRILVVLCLWTGGQAFGREAERVLTIEPGVLEGKLVGPWLEYVRDQSTDLASIRSRWDRLPIQTDSRSVPNLGITNQAHWLRLKLLNPGPSDQAIVLEHPYPSDSLWIFYDHPTRGWVEQRLGNKESGTGEFPYRNASIRLNITPGSHEVFFRLHHVGANKFPLRIWSLDRFASHKVWEEKVIGIFLGINAVMAFYNIFTFLMLRNPAYLNYVGLLLSSLLWLLFYSGIGRFMPDPLPFICGQMWITLMLAMIGFLLAFTLGFLEVKKRYPLLHRLMLLLMIVSFSMFAFELLVPFFAFYLAMVTINAALLVCFGVALHSAIRGYRPAWFYLASFLALLSGGMTESAVTLGFIGPEYGFWPFFGSYAFQTVLLSLAIGDQMQRKDKKSQLRIETLNKELQHHVEFIREIVEEKTRDIYSILITIQQGIFTITWPQKTIHKDYSPHLEVIFSKSVRIDEPALDYLFSQAIIGADARQQCEAIIDLILGSDRINFDFNQGSLPREIVRASPSGGRQVLELDWSPILDRHQRVEKVLVTVRDVTLFRTLEKTASDQQNTIDALQQLLTVGADRSARGLRELDTLYQDCLRIFRSMHDDDVDAWRRLGIHLHTMKGCARSLQMQQLCDALHQAEQKCVRRSREDLNILGPVHEHLSNYKELYRNLYGGHALGASEVVLVSDIERLLRQARQTPQMTIKSLVDSLNTLLYKDMEAVLRECFEGMSEIAQGLGKFEPLVHLEADSVMVSREEERVIKQAFIHLIRNSLDHGIELPDERLKKGKDPQGNIYVQVVIEERTLIFSYWDDGRGVSLESLQSKAQEMGILPGDRQLSREEIVQSIFVQGFSTSRRISYDSGRGIGLDAVREYFRSRGGDVSVRLIGEPVDACQPIRFEARLPSVQAGERVA
jgi:signal transduction histidine kinase